MREFIQKHYKHFNAAVITDAAQAWVDHLERGGKMFLAMAGAMSTAEIGLSLAQMIREEKIHAISTTGANLEEDLFLLVAKNHYRRIPAYRSLTPQMENELCQSGFNRVTDTCIPEEHAIRKLGGHLLDLWKKADKGKKRYFPYQYMYQLIESGALKDAMEGDPQNSWVVAAYEKQIPIYTPGWEDSTMGNGFVANILKNEIRSYHIMKSGLEQMEDLIQWYRGITRESSVGFFQIGGGIAGDFPICVVPLIIQDLKEKCKLWGYFAQISDSTTSYGSYSGAVPNEKITWTKLGVDTPKYMIESDASIVAPLIFSYVLDH
ncbi:MAG: deoxyhypusine synthase family protein [Candidatus Omnitrophica bacterium]|nr:deoxyhypusine synthase family protein [Candidatus Omnitrophota bacterium]